MQEYIEYISRHKGLRILIDEEVVHYSAEGRHIVKRARFVDFQNGNAKVPVTDTKAIAICDKSRHCQRFEDTERAVNESGVVTKEVIDPAEWITKEEVIGLIGNEKELKKLIAFGDLHKKKTTEGTRYSMRDVQKWKLANLGIRE